MQGQSTHAPLASLAAHWHACQGDIPPPLVGASITLVDDNEQASTSSLEMRSPGKVYLFGGRLVTTRRMINDLYILDLSTLRWTRHVPMPRDIDADIDTPLDSEVPQPRYFHSCDLWNNKLIIFGGMGYDISGASDLCVLNETVAFDLITQQWDLNFGASIEEMPQARYAHLSSITADSLVIIGGQDMGNQYVESIDVFDLEQRAWTRSQSFPKQRGSYRSLAVGPSWLVDDHISSSSKEMLKGEANSVLSKANIQLLPTSRKSRNGKGKERHLPIYVYTNYNFTDVKREMEVVKVLDQIEGEEEEVRIQIEDQMDPMNGTSLPPGLRFPMGAILGNYLIISGTYLANTSQTFSIWALNLPKMTWTRIDVGQALATGSWNRGILWPNTGRMLVFGHRDRDLVSDYNHRQTNWDHLLMLDLEAWGITRPPLELVSTASIELGLQKLSSSTLGSLSHSLTPKTPEGGMAPLLGGRGDFEILCSDGVRLGCDRVVLERRWPWFAMRLQDYRARAAKEAQRMSKRIFLDCSDKSIQARLTPRQLIIREPSPVMLSLLIFFYTQSICTTFQRHPAIVASLLIISKVYEMPDLQMWARHAAHHSLATDLAPADSTDPRSRPISTASIPKGTDLNFSPEEKHRLAVALYEAATICGYEALQIRALRNVMAVAKWVQRSSIMSTRSNEVPSEPHVLHAHTPNTATSSSHYGDTSTSTSIRSAASTNITSPGSKRMSTMSGGSRPRGESISRVEEGSAGMARKLSKAERMLGMNGSDGHNSIKMNGDGLRGTPVGQGVNRASSQTAVPTQQNMVSNLRRPSAPLLSNIPSNGSNASRGTTTTDYASNSYGSKKRFSIFGRLNDQQDGTMRASPIEDATIGGSAERLQARMLQRSMSNGVTEGSPSNSPHEMSPSHSAIGVPGSLAERRKAMERGKMSSMSRLRSGPPSAITETATPPGSAGIIKINPTESNALYSIASL